jgi:hypothetical protein
MTKSETREFDLILSHAINNQVGADYLARSLSALYRAARSKKTQTEILAVALTMRVISHDEFII